jgi:hypothetical protein
MMAVMAAALVKPHGQKTLYDPELAPPTVVNPNWDDKGMARPEFVGTWTLETEKEIEKALAARARLANTLSNMKDGDEESEIARHRYVDDKKTYHSVRCSFAQRTMTAAEIRNDIHDDLEKLGVSLGHSYQQKSLADFNNTYNSLPHRGSKLDRARMGVSLTNLEWAEKEEAQQAARSKMEEAATARSRALESEVETAGVETGNIKNNAASRRMASKAASTTGAR